MGIAGMLSVNRRAALIIAEPILRSIHRATAIGFFQKQRRETRKYRGPLIGRIVHISFPDEPVRAPRNPTDRLKGSALLSLFSFVNGGFQGIDVALLPEGSSRKRYAR